MYKKYCHHLVFFSLLLANLVFFSSLNAHHEEFTQLLEESLNLSYRPDDWDYHASFDDLIGRINLTCDGIDKNRLNSLKILMFSTQVESFIYMSDKVSEEKGKEVIALSYGFHQVINYLIAQKIPLTAPQVAFMYDFLYGPIRKGYDPEGISEEEELKLIPLRVRFGITICLCGFFLYILPDARLQNSGKWMMASGSAMVTEGMLNKLEQDEKDKKGKKKKR